jgi:hypothetical protein
MEIIFACQQAVFATDAQDGKSKTSQIIDLP